MMPVTLKWALRDLRGSLSNFWSFLICLMLGVASIVAVISLSTSLSDSINQEGQVLLGGDMEVSLANRRATEVELSALKKYGAVSEVLTMRAMARKIDGDKTALVEIKLIDDFYPFFGELKFENGFRKQELFIENQNSVAVEKELLEKIGLKIGESFYLGDGAVTVRSIIMKEPDRISSGFVLRPRVMMDKATLNATGLLSPGALLRWRYRIALEETSPFQNVSVIEEQLKQDFPDAGWRIQTSKNAAPGIRRFVDRLTLFFTMMALTSLIVGGVAIATGVRTYLVKKQASIATLKCLGASSRQILQTYFIETSLISFLGIALGLVLGASMPFILSGLLGDLIPFPYQASIYPSSLIIAALFGLITAFMFSLWPLGQAVRTRAADLFRSTILPLQKTPSVYFKLATGFLICVLVLLFLSLSEEKRLILYYFGAIFLGTGFLFFSGFGIRKLAKLIAPHVSFTPRLALRAIYRPGSLTGIMLVSLGLGLMLLACLSLIEFNISKQVSRSIPEKAPSYFFIGIEKNQTAEFKKIVHAQDKTSHINIQPLLNGRVISVKNIRSDKAPAAPDVKWVLRGDRGLTFSENIPEGSKLVAGTWWEHNYQGMPLVSITQNIAKGLGLEIGDMIEVSVLGRNVRAKIANMREVEWSSLGINFVLVFSPNSFAGAPYTYLATISTVQGEDSQLISTIANQFSNIYAISVRESIGSVISLMEKMSWAMRGASLFAILVAIFVLAGSLASQNRSRLYELGILKSLGATRRTLVNSYIVEFCFLGLITGIFAAIAGSLCSYMIVEEVLRLNWSFSVTAIFSTMLLALLLTLGLGMASMWRLLGRKPAAILNMS